MIFHGYVSHNQRVILGVFGMAINIPALPGTAATAQPWRLRLAGEGKEAQKPQRWLKHSGSWVGYGSYWLLLGGHKKYQDAQKT